MRMIIKLIRHIKQTVLLLSMLLTLNIYSMVKMVARGVNRRMICSFLPTCLPLQKVLSRGEHTRMLSTTGSRKQYEEKCKERTCSKMFSAI